MILLEQEVICDKYAIEIAFLESFSQFWDKSNVSSLLESKMAEGQELFPERNALFAFKTSINVAIITAVLLVFLVSSHKPVEPEAVKSVRVGLVTWSGYTGNSTLSPSKELLLLLQEAHSEYK